MVAVLDYKGFVKDPLVSLLEWKKKQELPQIILLNFIKSIEEHITLNSELSNYKVEKQF